MKQRELVQDIVLLTEISTILGQPSVKTMNGVPVVIMLESGLQEWYQTLNGIIGRLTELVSESEVRL